MIKYGVIGMPIAHSKAPYVYAEFAKQVNQEISYVKLESTDDMFFYNVKKFFADGGMGLNVTAPFKQMVGELVNKLSSRAKFAEAINVISYLEDDVICGDNTDGVGFIKDLKINNNYSIKAKKILVLGAGGAVKGILPELLLEDPKHITIVDINPVYIKYLANKYKLYKNIEISNYAELEKRDFDLVINGTSASMKKALPPIPDSLSLKNTWCYDIVYDDAPTSFIRWAKSKGAFNCIDGIGMLVEALAASFYIWRKVKPETRELLSKLKKQQYSFRDI